MDTALDRHRLHRGCRVARETLQGNHDPHTVPTSLYPPRSEPVRRILRLESSEDLLGQSAGRSYFSLEQDYCKHLRLPYSSADNRHDKTLTYGLSIADNEKMLNGVFSVWYLEADIARAAGVKPQTIQVYRKRGQFPDPDAESISGRPLWTEATVKKWLDERKHD